MKLSREVNNVYYEYQCFADLAHVKPQTGCHPRGIVFLLLLTPRLLPSLYYINIRELVHISITMRCQPKCNKSEYRDNEKNHLFFVQF